VPTRDTGEYDEAAARPTPTIEQIENRWKIGTPAVPDFGKRTLTALVALLLLLAVLYLATG
jgi:hypothetical protein